MLLNVFSDERQDKSMAQVQQFNPEELSNAASSGSVEFSPARKKAYSAPKLTTHGPLATLTQTGTTPGKEGPGGGNGVRLP